MVVIHGYERVGSQPAFNLEALPLDRLVNIVSPLVLVDCGICSRTYVDWRASVLGIWVLC